MNIESDHFKTLEELIDTIKMWVEVEEEYYSRYFGLNEMNILVEEIERLKEEIKGYEQERERVLNIIDERNHKAIEYIEKNCILSNTWKDLDFCNFVPIGKIKYKDLSNKKVKELLDILKGVELTEKDKKQIKWLKEEFKVGVEE